MARLTDKELMDIAVGMLERSYAPYSHFHVGAALLTEDGKVFTGCNIENAAFTPGICAERTAIYKAVSEGEKKFSAIAVVGARDGVIQNFCSPCGVCRQVMREFCDPESFRIILRDGEGNLRSGTLAYFLPESFGPEDLGN